MQCVVLAGGLATRLGSLSSGTPKSLVKACGKPFIDYQLALLARNGIDRATYCIGHLGEQIRAHVGNGDRFGLRVDYVDEGDKRLGTAGALRLALDTGALDDRVFVTFGDSYLPIFFRDVWAAAESVRPRPLMTVFRNEGRWDGSNVILQDRRVRLYEKGRQDTKAIGMAWIDYGLLVLERHHIETMIPAEMPFDLSDVCHRLSLAGVLEGFEVFTRFYEIGTPQGLADFEDLARRELSAK